MNKKGQVTIFIIIAIVIIVLGILLYLFYPKIKAATEFGAKNPSAFIQSCIEDKIKETADILSLQGGSINPEHYFTYNDINIEYLCYTNKNYDTCIIQQPLLKQHIESEIKNNTQDEAEACFQDLKESYEKKGYNVNLVEGETLVELLPERIVTTFKNELTVTKGESERYETFSVVLNNNLYELISIANSIIAWEATYGDADPRIYMTYYPDLKVEKNLRDDGTRIYVLTNRDKGNKFQFASRSLVFPPGH